MSEDAFSRVSPQRGPRFALAALAMVLLAAIVIVALLRDRIVNKPENQVTVTGEGRVPYQPDTAMVTLGVQVDKVDTAENALRQLNEKVARVIPAIKGLGISEKDILTQSYSLSPQYDFIDNVSLVSGYNANQELVVTVRDIIQNKDLVNRVIAEATRAGANQINSIAFNTSKLNELEQQARLKAMADAKSKAGVMAQAAGIKKLGHVIGWYENVVKSPENTTQYFDGMGGEGTSASPQVTSGGQEIVIEIGLSYQVK